MRVWYVTGEHGGLRHLGNAFTRRGDGPESLEPGANAADLRSRFDTLPSPAQPALR